MDYEKILNNKSIWIYGWSNLGRNAYNRLLKLFPDQVKGILVSEYSKRSREKAKNYGRKIYEIDTVEFEKIR